VESTHAFSAHGPGIYYGNHGASWFALTADYVAQAGLFDENIYPAYLEDCDYARRCDLLWITRANVLGCLAVHGEPVQPGSCTVNATPELAQKNCRTHGGSHEYYRAKWGGGRMARSGILRRSTSRTGRWTSGGLSRPGGRRSSGDYGWSGNLN